jgi:hypothetical protein
MSPSCQLLKVNKHSLLFASKPANSVISDLMETVKGKLSVGLNNQAPCHEGLQQSGGIVPAFLTSGREGKWSTSCPCCFTAEKRALGTHYI